MSNERCDPEQGPGTEASLNNHDRADDGASWSPADLDGPTRIQNRCRELDTLFDWMRDRCDWEVETEPAVEEFPACYKINMKVTVGGAQDNYPVDLITAHVVEALRNVDPECTILRVGDGYVTFEQRMDKEDPIELPY